MRRMRTFDVSMQFSRIQFAEHVDLNEDDDLFVVCGRHLILEDLKTAIRQFYFKSKGENTIQCASFSLMIKLWKKMSFFSLFQSSACRKPRGTDLDNFPLLFHGTDTSKGLIAPVTQVTGSVRASVRACERTGERDSRGRRSGAPGPEAW